MQTQLSRVKSISKDNNGSYQFAGYECLPERLDAIFLSPPWGGVEYEQIGPRHFDLSCIQLTTGMGDDDVQNVNGAQHAVVDGADLLRLAAAALPADRLKIGYFLPRNLNGMTFAQICHDECGIRGCIEMEQHILNEKLKTVAVYIDSNAS